MTGSVLPSDYRADIDGLRAVAVLAVVFNHLSASLLPGGYVGVDVFFVISGYLITRIISREMVQGSFTFARFYERRARRIFPALFAVMAATLGAGYVLLLPSDYAATLRGALGTVFFASNIVFWREMQEGYFAATDLGLNPLLHTWSLAVEEQFYVIFPVLLLLCYRRMRHHIGLVLLLCTVVSLAGASLLVKDKSVAVFFLSPFRGWELLIGSLLALEVVPRLRSRAAREVTAGGGLLSILLACIFYNKSTTFPGLAALAPVLGTAAIIHAGTSGPSAVGRLLQWRPMVYIGLISYSLYLWHWPLIVLVRYVHGTGPITSYIPALLAGSLALASLSYHFIERPFRQGRRIGRQALFRSTAVFASVLAGVSVAGLMNGGFETRFMPKVVELDKARSRPIPFRECDGKPAGSWCSIGHPDTQIKILLWGDSHMMALTSAFSEILNTAQARATLVTRGACPPLLGLASAAHPSCLPQNTDVKNYLLAHPEIEIVVIAARWSKYFANGNGLSTTDGNALRKDADAARIGLTSTIKWIIENNKRLVLIGPVPDYDRSVPLALALEETNWHAFPRTTLTAEQEKNEPFLRVIDETKRDGSSFHYLDPLTWMCSQECVTTESGDALYWDSNHLSTAGAMALKPHIATGLMGLGL